MAGAKRVAVLLLVAALLPLALSGCFGKTLVDATGFVSESKELEQTFTVEKGTDRIVARFKAADSPGGGSVSVVLSPTGLEALGQEVGFGTAPGGGKGEAAVDDPEPGTWIVIAEGEDGYEGNVDLVVGSDGGGALLSIGGSFWDIAGVVLALVTIVGGVVLYKRRNRFLSRELNRIDETVRLFGDDIEECRTNLVEMQAHIKDLLVKGKIQESQYLILEKRIDKYLADLATPGNRHKAKDVGGEFDLEMEPT